MEKRLQTLYAVGRSLKIAYPCGDDRCYEKEYKTNRRNNEIGCL